MNTKTAGDWMTRLADHGDREALLVDGETFTYSQLALAAGEAAEGLKTMGVEGGDLVAVLASPSVSGVALIHALLDQRIALLPLNTRLTEAERIDALTRTGARFLIVGPGVDGDEAQRLSERVGCGLILFSSTTERPAVFAELTLQIPVAEGEAIGDDEDRRLRVDDGIAFVLLTSGTSGRPKAAMLTRDNLIASAQGSMQLLGSDARDRWLLCMPLFHIGGLSVLVRSALAGTSVVIHDRFEAMRVATAFDADGITRVSFVATMLDSVIEARGDRPAPASLVLVLLGGGPASEDLLRRAESLGYPIAPTYGLTEAASQVATRPPAKLSRSANAHGGDIAGGLEPLPGIELRIVDASGDALASGVEGEIQVRGAIVMKGYLGDPVATANAIKDGWLATGDIGRLDTDGRLRVFDRRADLILSGGENVYPAEIESVLADHADVVEAGVVGCPDAKFGARPLAYVVLRPDATLDRAALLLFCQERLAGYKIPVDFIEIERAGLPRTASGKLKRRTLRGQRRSNG